MVRACPSTAVGRPWSPARNRRGGARHGEDAPVAAGRPLPLGAGNVVVTLGPTLLNAALPAEAALRDSEAFLRSVLDASTDCLKVMDAEGHLDFMNANGLCLMEIDGIVLL